jgi:predicted GNAT family acetyltransferase
MLKNQLLAEERRLARLKTKHELQKVAEAELSTVEGTPFQLSSFHDTATTSVLNNETATSSELMSSKINSSTAEAVGAHELNTTFKLVNDQDTSAVCSAYATGGTGETVEVEVIDTISKPNEPGKTTTFSHLVDAEETKATSKQINVKQTDTALMPINALQVDAEVTGATAMPVDAEGTGAASVHVDAEETGAASMPVDAEETGAASC